VSLSLRVSFAFRCSQLLFHFRFMLCCRFWRIKMNNFPSGPDGHLARSYAGLYREQQYLFATAYVRGKSINCGSRTTSYGYIRVRVRVRVRIRSHSPLTYSPQVSGHWSCDSDVLHVYARLL